MDDVTVTSKDTKHAGGAEQWLEQTVKSSTLTWRESVVGSTQLHHYR